MDILAANPLCYALYAGILTPQTLPLNLARFLFLDPRAPELFVEWDTAAALRTEAGRSPRDRNLTDLIGELATRSDEFRTRWARHNVRLHRTSHKRIRHALVGEVQLTGDALELPGEGLTLITYTAPAGSAPAESPATAKRQPSGKPTPTSASDSASSGTSGHLHLSHLRSPGGGGRPDHGAPD